MKVWTFHIRGGQAIGIRVPGSPALEHPEGGQTIWKMVGTNVQAVAVQGVLEAHGCEVKRYTETQSPEQEAVRRQRLAGSGVEADPAEED